jgi:hypothetical protein
MRSVKAGLFLGKFQMRFVTGKFWRALGKIFSHTKDFYYLASALCEGGPVPPQTSDVFQYGEVLRGIW